MLGVGFDDVWVPKRRIYLLKRTPHPHIVLSPSYKRSTTQIYAQKFMFYAVSLKIRLNWHNIMKLDDKNIICVLLKVFFTIIQFLSELWAFLIYLYYARITQLKTELSQKKTSKKAQSMFLPSSFIISRFARHFKLTAYNVNFWA